MIGQNTWEIQYFQDWLETWENDALQSITHKTWKF